MASGGLQRRSVLLASFNRRITQRLKPSAGDDGVATGVHYRAPSGRNLGRTTKRLVQPGLVLRRPERCGPRGSVFAPFRECVSKLVQAPLGLGASVAVGWTTDRSAGRSGSRGRTGWR